MSSSDLEDVVLQDDWHFLFMVMGTLQFSKYLESTTTVRHVSCFNQPLMM